MFFSKRLAEISYQDVLEFCATKIKENEVLDYKETFPSKLEKTIAAFANTYGGLIIIGVGDDDGIPEENPSGINFARGLEERVTSIVVTNIQPVVFPEIQVCSAVKGKTFVLIQVPQSANTPHTIDNKRRVYLRTGNISTPEELANMDELHWLSRHRESSTWLRKNTTSLVDDQFRAQCQHNNVNLNFAEIKMQIVPEYPKYLPIDMPRLKNEIISKAVDTAGGSRFPYFRAQIQTMKDSLYLFHNVKNELGEFTEYTIFHRIGLFGHIKDYGRLLENSDGSTSKGLNLSRVVDEYYNFLRFYKNLCSDLDIWGDYRVRVSLIKMQGVKILPIVYSHFPSAASSTYLMKSHNYEGLLYQKDFADKQSILEEVADLAENLHWSFDLSIVDKDKIGRWLSEQYKNIF